MVVKGQQRSAWRLKWERVSLAVYIQYSQTLSCWRILDVEWHSIVFEFIFSSSVLGHVIGTSGSTRITIYPASKFAVKALTESLRQELVFLKSKIKVSSVSPGLVGSEFLEASASNSGAALSKEAMEAYKARPKLKPEDVADAVIYVLSTPPHVQVHELILRPVGQEV